MSLSKDEIAKKLGKEDVLNDLLRMQEPVEYKLVAKTRKSLLRAALKKIPWLSNFLQTIDDSGETIFHIGERVSSLDTTPSSESIGHGFHFGSVVMAGLDFFRIPIIYLAAYILNKKIPITLDNNARWLYSGILLALAITALAVPGIAPIIGFVAAGIGLTVSLFLLGKTLYARYQLAKESQKLQKELTREEEQMQIIQQEAKALHEKLTAATEEERIVELYMEIVLLQERYISQQRVLEKLKTEELHLKQKIDQVGLLTVFDKSIGVCLTGLTIIGLSLSLFFPAVGLGILLGVAITGGVYLFGRLTAPFAYSLGLWVINKFKTALVTVEPGESLANDNKLGHPEEALDKTTMDLVQSNDEEVPHESTTDVLVELLKTDVPGEVLQFEQEHEKNEQNPMNYTLLKPAPNKVNKKKQQDSESEGERIIQSETPQSH